MIQESLDFGAVQTSRPISQVLKDVDSRQEAILVKVLSTFDYTPTTQRASSPASKWRMISALQKAVRRGNVQAAVKFAVASNALDPLYCYYRMSVIAIEDIGSANPDLAVLFIWASRNKAVRDKLGAEKVVAYFATEMAKSVKDRNA